MKKIAIDIDGVVFDTEDLFRVYSEIYDVDILKRNSIIDNRERTFQKRYNWTEAEKANFYNSYAQEILENGNVMPGADIVLKKLYEEYEILVVTARNDNEMKYVYNFLEANNLKDVKIFNNEHDKIDRYIHEGVNYVVDDDKNICINASKHNIMAFYFKSAAADKIEEAEHLKIVNNWGEIYKYLKLNI